MIDNCVGITFTIGITYFKGITTVTQKGQITLPKKIRDKFNISPRDNVVVKIEDNKIVVDKAGGILSIAGKYNAPKGKNALIAREYMENNYERS